MDENPGSLLITGMRKGHIMYVMKSQIPAIIITGMENEPKFDFSGFSGFIYMTPLTAIETIRRIRMAEPIRSIMGEQSEEVDHNEMNLHPHAHRCVL